MVTDHHDADSGRTPSKVLFPVFLERGGLWAEIDEGEEKATALCGLQRSGMVFAFWRALSSRVTQPLRCRFSAKPAAARKMTTNRAAA